MYYILKEYLLDERLINKYRDITMGITREILKNFLFIIGVVLFFLLVAEVTTRLVMPNSVKFRLMHQPDEKLGYRLAPNYEIEHKKSEFNTLIKINSEGLRDYEHQKDKKSSLFRILVMGDSFTFGLGVNSEETYAKVLETLLNQNLAAKTQKKYEVINAGIDGYGTEQEYFYLKELGNQYRPDLVIVGLYANDITDVMQTIPFIYNKNRIKTRFYFLSYLKELHTILKVTLRNDIQSTILQIYQDQYTPQFEKALQKTQKILLETRDFIHSIGAEMVIVIVPLTFEIGRSEWEKGQFGHLYRDEFFNKNMHKFSTIFTEFGKVEEIHTLPLLPIFRKSKKKLYYVRDPHWNKEGHLLAAESIYNFLEKKGLVAKAENNF
jgi:lysophospholipase L1-like esterase